MPPCAASEEERFPHQRLDADFVLFEESVALALGFHGSRSASRRSRTVSGPAGMEPPMTRSRASKDSAVGASRGAADARDATLRVYSDRGGQVIPALIDVAQTNGRTVTNIHLAPPSLETLFIALTGRALAAPDHAAGVP